MSTTPPPPTPPARSTLRGLARQPAFLVAVGILAVAAAGLNASVGYLKLHFKKEAVPMARPLGSIPRDLGVWRQVSVDEPLDPEIEHALGTKEYVFRDYVDTRLVDPSLLDGFKDLSREQRLQRLAQIRGSQPKAVVNLAVTYYTGLVDTVAHVPDRCYVADGYEPKTYDEVNWNIDDGRPVQVRYINFEDGTGRSSVTRSVAYFFHVNGGFQCSPEAVRVRLQNLLERHGYYAKVEVMTLIDDHAESARVMTDFLASALPEVRKSLPDWDAVKRGGSVEKPVATAAR